MKEESAECVSFFLNPNFSASTFDIYEEVDKEELNSSVYDEELYNICSMVERKLMYSQMSRTFVPLQVNGNYKRMLQSPDINPKAKRRSLERGSPLSLPIATCDGQSDNASHMSIGQRLCALQLNNYAKNHKDIKSSPTNVSVIESAFGQRKIQYKIDTTPVPDSRSQTPLLLLDSIQSKIMFLIEQCIQQHVILEVKLILNAEYSQSKNVFSSYSFQSSSYILMEGDDFLVFFTSVRDCLVNEVHIFEKENTNISLKLFKTVEIDVVTGIQKLIDNSWHVII